MTTMDRLNEDHQRLRSCLAGMGELLGRPNDPGWYDEKDLDRPRLAEVRRQLHEAFRAHEELERLVLSQALARLSARGGLPPGCIESAHRSIRDILQLLDAVAHVCDGRHVHSLRSVASRAAEEVERHLAYEERELLPRLQDRETLAG